ncbi:MAG: hypothetical protein KatS3mg102_0722 [Planctomycetota bacterium]|nr:MAG: hypothetical protein KatS3mg102_0722 [Planctomycetota bacterium]
MQRWELLIGERVRMTYGRSAPGSPYCLDGKDLVTHMFICGATGSGKTVLAKAVVEELACRGVSSIVIDLKGDLTSLALKGTHLFDKRLEASYRALLGDSFEAERERFRIAWARDPDAQTLAERFSNRVRIKVFSPLSQALEPLSFGFFPTAPENFAALSPEEKEDFLLPLRGFAVAFVAKLYKGRKSKKAELGVPFIEEIIKYCWENEIPTEGEKGICNLVSMITDPPFDHVGAQSLPAFISEGDRRELASRVNTLLMGAARLSLKGRRFCVSEALGLEDGKPTICILNLVKLGDFMDRAIVVAHVAYELNRWMRTQSTTETPRALFYLDELGGEGGGQSYFPSYPRNPPSKPPLNILVRQGRSFGVCCLFATQNVADLDVRALTNLRTWALGRLTSPADLRRLTETHGTRLLANGATIAEAVAQLDNHHFLVLEASGDMHLIHERHLHTVHTIVPPERFPHLRELLQLSQELENTDGGLPPVVERSETAPPAATARAAPHVIDRVTSQPISPRPAAPPAASEAARPGTQRPVETPAEHSGPAAARAESPVERPGGARQAEARLESSRQEPATRTFVAEETRLFVEEDDERVEHRPTHPALRVLVNDRPIPRSMRAGERWIFGRAHGCDVLLEDPHVSRRQFEVAHLGDRVRITVLPSKNRTNIEGVRQGDGTFLIAPGVVIRVAKTRVTLQVE